MFLIKNFLESFRGIYEKFLHCLIDKPQIRLRLDSYLYLKENVEAVNDFINIHFNSITSLELNNYEAWRYLIQKIVSKNLKE